MSNFKKLDKDPATGYWLQMPYYGQAIVYVDGVPFTFAIRNVDGPHCKCGELVSQHNVGGWFGSFSLAKPNPPSCTWPEINMDYFSKLGLHTITPIEGDWDL
jgi:hypothetical protein